MVAVAILKGIGLWKSCPPHDHEVNITHKTSTDSRAALIHWTEVWLVYACKPIINEEMPNSDQDLNDWCYAYSLIFEV